MTTKKVVIIITPVITINSLALLSGSLTHWLYGSLLIQTPIIVAILPITLLTFYYVHLSQWNRLSLGFHRHHTFSLMH